MARIHELLADRSFVDHVYVNVNKISIIPMSPRMYADPIDPKITDDMLRKNEADIRALSGSIALDLNKAGLVTYTEDDVKLFIEEDVLVGF